MCPRNCFLVLGHYIDGEDHYDEKQYSGHHQKIQESGQDATPGSFCHTEAQHFPEAGGVGYYGDQWRKEYSNCRKDVRLQWVKQLGQATEQYHDDRRIYDADDVFGPIIAFPIALAVTGSSGHHCQGERHDGTQGVVAIVKPQAVVKKLLEFMVPYFFYRGIGWQWNNIILKH